MSHYKNIHIKEESVDYLKEYFEDGVDDMNFIMFGTSGIHGTRTDLDDIEECYEKYEEGHEDFSNYLTFLIIRPRMVSMLYGNIYVKKDEIPFLRKLEVNTANLFKIATCIRSSDRGV